MRPTTLFLAALVPLATTNLFGSGSTGQPTKAQGEKVPPIHGAAPQLNSATLQKADEYWQRAREEVYRSTDELDAQDARERRRGQFLPKLVRGNPSKRYLALTFDDGPHPRYTRRLLALLRDLRVTATFFVVGHQAELYPDLVRAEVAAGHTVGNHTFSHVTLTKIPDDDVRVEYRACNEMIHEITGAWPRYCRPPGGDYDKSVIDAATAENLTTVLWTDDPGDYARPGDDIIAERTLRKLSNGGIVLLHDGIEQTMSVLPQIVNSARARGFEFVSLSKLQASIQGPKASRSQ